MSHLSLLLLAAGFLIPPFAAAQDSSLSGLPLLEPGQIVRIRSSQGELLEGKFSRSPAYGSVLQLTDREVPLSGATVDSLWIRSNRWKTGALIGGLVLGAGSAVFWTEMCKIGTEGQPCDEIDKVVLLTAAGAAAGAGLGAFLGSAAGTWRLRYARPGVRVQVKPLSSRQVYLGVTLPL